MIATTKEAWERLDQIQSNLLVEEVALEKAFGRILATDVVAEMSVPSFRRSPYDGYALRSEDTMGATKEKPVVLKVNEVVAAGEVPNFQVKSGTATRIMTGAKLPEGADAIIMYEKTEFTETEVKIFSPVLPGNIIEIGEDVRKGSVLLEKGTKLSEGGVALIAGQGKTSVLVYRKPRVAILCTGAELVPVGEKIKDGKIYNTNGYLIAGYMQRFGLEPVYYGVVVDRPQIIEENIKKALRECDLVVTTGGVSAGDYDFLPSVLDRMGAEVLFHGLDFKPGGVITCGRYQNKTIFCLSGNPGSAATSLLWVCSPYLKRISGLSNYGFEIGFAKMRTEYPKSSRGNRILKGKLVLGDGEVDFELLNNQQNGSVSSMESCSVLAKIPAGSDRVGIGDKVKVYQF